MGPVLARRDRELCPERCDTPLEVFNGSRRPVIIKEDVASLALPSVGPFGIGILGCESAEERCRPAKMIQQGIGPALLIQQQVVQKTLTFVKVVAIVCNP